MEMSLALVLAGLAFVAGLLGLFLYFGLRSGRGDLIAPPKEFGKREYGKRPPVRPAPVKPAKPPAQQAEQQVEEPVAIAAAPEPLRALSPIIDEQEGSAEPAPVWRRDRPAGHKRLSEACYTAEQYAEREVKALLLQNRHDRAVRHVRKALKLPAAEAEIFVERLARGLRV